jgi:hypothetical protein
LPSRRGTVGYASVFEKANPKLAAVFRYPPVSPLLRKAISQIHPAKHPLVLLLAGATVSGAVATSTLLDHGRSAAKPLPPASPLTVPPVISSSPKSPATPVPDPNFIRTAPLKLASTSPEGERVLQDLQGAYRCLHTGNKRALAAWLSPGDAPTTAEELSESMQRSLSKLPDACYTTTALPQVINPRTPAPLMEVLFRDLEGRPNQIKLRTLFLIAGMESHPRADEALATLQTVLNTDYQRDWSRWDQAISNELTRESHGLRGVSCRIH